MIPRRTTPELRARITYLRERSWTIKAIADELGLTEPNVGRWCLILGAEPRKRQQPLPTRREAPFLRRGGKVNPFTAADDALIQGLRSHGSSLVAIARHLTALDPARPRGREAVRDRLCTLARRAALQEGPPAPLTISQRTKETDHDGLRR